jgi:hypothetical protein
MRFDLISNLLSDSFGPTLVFRGGIGMPFFPSVFAPLFSLFRLDAAAQWRPLIY